MRFYVGISPKIVELVQNVSFKMAKVTPGIHTVQITRACKIIAEDSCRDLHEHRRESLAKFTDVVQSNF